MLKNLPKSAVIFLIRQYQRTFSFDHGPLRFLYPYGFCRFYPSCSEYAREALCRRGFWRGAFSAIKRLLRCHPWSRGGIDKN